MIARIDGILTGTISTIQTIAGAVAPTGTVSGTITVGGSTAPPEYEGVYEITPTAETQTLDTEGRVLLENIIINPIPNNYGLITWNGSYLTVS